MSMMFRNPFSLSALLHLVVFAFCAMVLTQHQTITRKTTFIELVPYPQDLKKTETEPHQRVVQTLPGKKTDQAAQDAYLGERTQVVDRQTVSRDHVIEMGKALVSKPSREAEAARPVAIQNLGVPLLPSTQEIQKQALAQKASNGHDSSNFASDSEQAPKEYIQGMKEGEQTALNTKEFMFFSYFQRIRERLDRAWVPILKHNITLLYKGGRSLASEMDYSTRVMVIMNRLGEITRVEVQGESGAQSLDDAAIKAFNQAGPFPNPPKGIVDARGEIRIPWEFILRT